MNYTLNQLQIFLKVVEHQSITKAAEDLNLTQPAISIQLKNFQHQFDISLTETIGRQIHITDFGKEIAKISNKIIEQVLEMNQKTVAYKGFLVGKLKLSVVSTGKYVMPYFFTDFLHSNPNIELSMDVTNKNMVIESLLRNEVDFALVSILPEVLKIEKLDLLSNKLYLVGKNPPPLKHKNNAKEYFKNLPLIFREKGSGTRQTMEKFIDANQIVTLKKMELTSNEAIKQALIAGMGYSIMPLIGLRNELQNNDLSIIPIKGLPIVTTWSLIWLQGKKLSPVSEAFLNYLQKNKNQIISDKFSWFEKY